MAKVIKKGVKLDKKFRLTSPPPETPAPPPQKTKPEPIDPRQGNLFNQT